MTATDYDQLNYTEHRPADPVRPNTRRGKPDWVKLLEDDRLRILTAAQLEDAVNEMRGGTFDSAAQQASTNYLADQLGDVIAALRDGA